MHDEDKQIWHPSSQTRFPDFLFPWVNSLKTRAQWQSALHYSTILTLGSSLIPHKPNSNKTDQTGLHWIHLGLYYPACHSCQIARRHTEQNHHSAFCMIDACCWAHQNQSTGTFAGNQNFAVSFPVFVVLKHLDRCIMGRIPFGTARHKNEEEKSTLNGGEKKIFPSFSLMETFNKQTVRHTYTSLWPLALD